MKMKLVLSVKTILSTTKKKKYVNFMTQIVYSREFSGASNVRKDFMWERRRIAMSYLPIVLKRPLQESVFFAGKVSKPSIMFVR